MMKKLLGLTLDPQWRIAYLRYSNDESDGSLDLARDSNGVVRKYGFDHPQDQYFGVTLDVDRAGDVVGIEILNVDDSLERGLARDFASANNLEFPTDIRARAHHPAA